MKLIIVVAICLTMILFVNCVQKSAVIVKKDDHFIVSDNVVHRDDPSHTVLFTLPKEVSQIENLVALSNLVTEPVAAKTKRIISNTWNDLKNLDGIDAFPELTGLELENTSIESIGPHKIHPKITYFKIEGSKIVREVDLRWLSNVEHIFFNDLSLLSIPDMSTLAKLYSVSFRGSLSNVYPLKIGESLPRSIKEIFLIKNNIRKISDIGTLPESVEGVWLNSNLIENFDGIEMYANLKYIVLQDNPIQDQYPAKDVIKIGAIDIVFNTERYFP